MPQKNEGIVVVKKFVMHPLEIFYPTLKGWLIFVRPIIF